MARVPTKAISTHAKGKSNRAIMVCFTAQQLADPTPPL
jgi:hypothetical protein